MAATIPLVAGVIGIGTGVNSLLNSGSTPPAPGSQQGANAADPAAAQRPFFQDYLRNHFNNLANPDPRAIQDNPNYKFMQAEGYNDIIRADTANLGSTRGGTFGEDMAKYSSGLASSFIQQQFQNNMSVMDRLSGLGGFTTGSPAAAGQILATGGQQGYNNFNNSLGQIGAGLQVFGRNPPPSPTSWATSNSGPGYYAEGGGG